MCPPPRCSTRRTQSLFTDLCPFFAGKNREIKKAVEAYWASKLSAEELQKVAADIRKFNWTSIKEKGVDYISR
jgi:hypothetical protein